MTIIDIYTDGACKGNPGPGGWGAFLKSGDHEKDIFGGESQTTNNRMELMAVIEALKTLNNRSRIRLFIDSQYVKNGINIWISNWKKNGWRTSNKKAVKNVDLWVQLDELVPNHEIEWIWVKGHAGNFGNERADALANQGVPQ
ncbi:MAG: ribonuclease HI [Burkholderiales bacterium]|nr:ribonuclease HI [Burkholderiales bacterium]MDG2202947.1 ribonuclease HI [Burkholderiales bacterium]